jgi:predicted ArsR family transcriptional regulator
LGAEGPLPIVRLAEDFQISCQAVTKHLTVLADAGLVSGSRAGRESVWRLEAQGLSEARQLLEVISSNWDATLERLRSFVES